MVKTIYIPIFIIIFSLTACGHDIPITPSPAFSSGIEGLVIEGPMCPGPVAIGDNPCQDQPFQATISVLDNNNNLISQFQTDASGIFKVYLAPDIYILHPESGKGLSHAIDQSVVVTDGEFTRVTIKYDTGIR